MQLGLMALMILVMAGVTYLIRMLPFVFFRKKIKNRYVLSLLCYIPYAVLSAMTFSVYFIFHKQYLDGTYRNGGCNNGGTYKTLFIDGCNTFLCCRIDIWIYNLKHKTAEIFPRLFFYFSYLISILIA